MTSRSCSTLARRRTGADSSSPPRTWCSTPGLPNGRADSPGSTWAAPRLGAVADAGDYWQVRVSPDDRNLAVTARDPLLRSLDVLNVPVDEHPPAVRLTTSVAADTDPVWSPDGRELVFRSMKRGRPEILVTPAAITPVARRPGQRVRRERDGRSADGLARQRHARSARGKGGFDLVRVHTRTGRDDARRRGAVQRNGRPMVA